MRFKQTLKAVLAPAKWLGISLGIAIVLTAIATGMGWIGCALDLEPMGGRYCTPETYADFGIVLLMVPIAAVMFGFGLWIWLDKILDSYREDTLRSQVHEVGGGQVSVAAGGELSEQDEFFGGVRGPGPTEDA